MGGERLPSASVTSSGLVGDRCWAVRDEILGGIRGAKKFSALMRCHARLLREPDGPGHSGDVEITLPDHSTITTADETAGARLSAVLGHQVTVWSLQPVQDLDFYRLGRPTDEDPGAEARSMLGLHDDEPLPNVRRLPGDLRRQITEYASLPGTYFDAFPILVLTTASLDALRRLRPDAVIDVRRFRPNIVVATDPSLSGPVEHDWEGRTLHIGDVELELTWRCTRCVMITHGFDDIPTDRSLMRTIVRQFGHELGIDAVVKSPGQLSETQTASLR